MDQNQYKSLKYSAGFRQINNPGYIRIDGEGQIDFLQRQSTNDLKKLSDRNAIITVLTSPIAKILDILTVFYEDSKNQTISLFCLPGRSEQTTKFLQSKIFFMDKVVVHNLSDQFCHFELEGPLVEEYLGQAGIPIMNPKNDISIDGIGFRIFRNQFRQKSSFLLVAPIQFESTIQNFLIQHKIHQVADEVFDILRIEAGIPPINQELLEDYTPLEMKLDQFVASNKGCYTGQEILARQITYDKVTRKLSILKLPIVVNTGNTVLFESKQVGNILASAVSPEHGPIALAVLRRPHFEVNSQVLVQTEEDLIPAAVVESPSE